MIRLHILLVLNALGLACAIFAPDIVLPYLFAIFMVDSALQIDERARRTR